MWSLAPGRAGPAREEAAWEARPEKPITCLMDYPTNEQVEIHPQVEGHLMDARAQGE